MVDKKISICFTPMDFGGCGSYRIKYPGFACYNKAKVNISTPMMYNNYGQEFIYTQRVCNKDVFNTLMPLKDKGIKFVIDYDDCLWRELPNYNKCDIHYKENYQGMKEYLDKFAYKVTCTNEFLKKDLTEFVNEDKIIVMPNCLDYTRWRFNYIKPSDKISFFYAGSPTHYDGKNYGDFSGGLVHYLQNKTVYGMGYLPEFIKGKVLTNWVDIDFYPSVFYQCAVNSKFIIAPLADNYFNKCKSDLKYIESCAVGRVCLVSDFPDCPYSAVAHEYQKIPLNSTATAINYIVERANEHYDEIIEHQYKVLNERWLDANKYLQIFK